MKVKLSKLFGIRNAADIGTKALSADAIAGGGVVPGTGLDCLLAGVTLPGYRLGRTDPRIAAVSDMPYRSATQTPTMAIV